MLTTFDSSELFMQSLYAVDNGFLLEDVSFENFAIAIYTFVDGDFIAGNIFLAKGSVQTMSLIFYQSSIRVIVLKPC